MKVVEEANLYKAVRPVTFQDGVNQREEEEAPMLNRKNAANFVAQVHKHVAREHFHELLQKSVNKADLGSASCQVQVAELQDVGPEKHADIRAKLAY